MQYAFPLILRYETSQRCAPPDRYEPGRSYRSHALYVVFAIGLVLLLIANGAGAADITVQSDRNPVALNESFELTFTAGSSVDGEPDFTPLQHDFDLLNQAQSSNISLINGRYSKTTSWTLNLMPKRAGILTVPAIAFGGDSSRPIRITINASPDGRDEQSADADIFLEVEAEPANPYVQQQVIVTVRVLNRVDIAQASLSEPELSEAIIEKLGKDSQYHTQRNGLRYLAIERKYAIFPQQSGEAVIAPVELNAQIPAGRGSRSMFGGFLNRQMTRTQRLRSEPVTLQVRPIPAAFTGKHWLPAKQVTLKQHWSTQPPAIAVGEPITHTVSLAAEGVTVSQLPEIGSTNQPIHSNNGDDIKQYPDQPTLEENKTSDGLISRREQKTALIPAKAGDYTLRGLSVPWWNTATDRMEIARLPQQVLKALPPSQVDASTSDRQAASITEPAIGSDPILTIGNDAALQPTVWRWASLLLAVGWAMTAAAWLLRHKRARATSDSVSENMAEKTAIKTIKRACADNRPDQTKEALLTWAKVHWQEPPRSLAEIARRCSNPVQIEIERLSRSLYSRQSESWQGKDLWQTFSSMQKNPPKKKKTDRPVLEPLYKT